MNKIFNLVWLDEEDNARWEYHFNLGYQELDRLYLNKGGYVDYTVVVDGDKIIEDTFNSDNIGQSFGLKYPMLTGRNNVVQYMIDLDECPEHHSLISVGTCENNDCARCWLKALEKMDDTQVWKFFERSTK